MEPYIDPRNPPYNAAGNGTTDDTAALNSAIAAAISAKTILDGGAATYAVSGDLTISNATNPHLRNLTLKQLTPNATTRRTLYITNCNRVILENIKIDRNGTGTGGSLGDAAGLWIDGGSGHHFGLVEAYGNDKGSGIVIVGVSDSYFEDLYAHDIAYNDPSATDDLVQGVWLNTTTNCTASVRVNNLTGNASGTFPNRFTRGLAMSRNTRCTIVSPKIHDVDQGIDISGSDGNIDCVVVGGHVRNATTWGVKLANSAVRCKVIGTVVDQAGMACFVASGPSENALPNKTMDCEFIGCTALNAGYNGFSASEKSGYRILPQNFDPDFPKGIKIVDCRAFDTQSTKTMQYGFRNTVVYDGTSGKINELADCTSIGHTASFSIGFGSWTCCATGSGSQSFASGVQAPLSFNAELVDGAAMHSTTVNPTRITIVQPGDYLVEGKVTFAANSASFRRVFLKVNGNTNALSRMTVISAGNVAMNTAIAPIELRLVSGDYIELWAEQQSGVTLSVDLSESFLQASLIRTI
jgi:hypothetical protein